MKDINIINIFVACSSSSENLNEKKEELMKMCNDMNIEFAEKGQCFAISPVSYEDLERRMFVFSDYINNKADIVVFLIDETLGPFMEEKLQLAAGRAYSHTKPELLVFVSKDIDKEQEQKIREILKKDGWLYDQLDSTQNMLANVKKRIKGFVGEYENKRRKRIKNQITHWFVVGLVILLSVWGGYKIINLRKQIEKLETKRLLIVGGGSARNYIEEARLTGKEKEKGLVKLKPDYWWYAPMPSGDSYRIIAEEIINFGVDYKKRPYYPIVISAERITNDSIPFRKNKTIEQFRDKAIVAGIQLDNDTLIVYSADNTILDSDSISCSKLNNLIQDTTIITLRTSVNSGTFKSYVDNSVCPDLNKVKNRLRFFSDTDVLSKQYQGEKWLALGSRYYRPKDEGVASSIVYNNNDCIAKKPICVYFLLYNKKTDTSSVKEYILPDATKEFLNKIMESDVKKDTLLCKIENINHFISETDSTILYYITDSALLYYRNGLIIQK